MQGTEMKGADGGGEDPGSRIRATRWKLTIGFLSRQAESVGRRHDV